MRLKGPVFVMAAAAIAGFAAACIAQPVVLDSTGSTAEPPTTVTPREGCVTAECHPGVKDHRFLHGPVQVNACDACHALTDAATHQYVPARGRDSLCLLCHVVDVTPDATKHEPLAKGECLPCHEPHGSPEKAMLRGAHYADACKTCHKDVAGGHDLVHGPASAGACGACHEPHASPLPQLLNAEGRDLCLRCHMTTGLLIESRRVAHEPARGDCRVCHDPHATDSPAILSADPVTLCTGCHEDIAKTMSGATTPHGALTTERSCLNCHAPHASDHPALLREEPATLCFECHNTSIALKDGGRLLNMKELIERGKSLHGAIAQGSCVVCHEIHGGGHRRLLTNEYPTDLYYPFSESLYSLCFSCHDRQLALLSHTETVTAFRNGDRNLHYAHVNRAEKGRSCRICHDSHAANRERHIRDAVPFGPGGWLLPIKYERLPDGGRCGAGCHAAFEYSRVNPVVYPADKGGEEWKGADLVPGVRAEPPKDPPDPPKK